MNKATGNQNNHSSLYFFILPSYTHRLGLTLLMLIIRTFKRAHLPFYFIYSYIHLYINCLVMSVQVSVTYMRRFLRPMPKVSVRARGPLMAEVSLLSSFYLFWASMPSSESEPYHRCFFWVKTVFQLPQQVLRGCFYYLARDSRLIPFH